MFVGFIKVRESQKRERKRGRLKQKESDSGLVDRLVSRTHKHTARIGLPEAWQWRNRPAKTKHQTHTSFIFLVHSFW